MSDKPSISILLPTHNRFATVKIALESLRAQSFQDWEVLVVGDGCVDGTGNFLLELASSDDRVRWFDLPKAEGFGYANRNVALRQARGDLIGFLADDDLYIISHVERLVALMADPEAQLGVTGSLWVDASGNMIPVAAPLADVGYLACFLGGENRIPASSFVHRRALLDEVGYWNEDLLKLGDLDLWQRIIHRYGPGSLRADPRHSIVHFRAPWKRSGSDPDPHDFATWQELIRDARLDPGLVIAAADGLLQATLWDGLRADYAAGSERIERAAGRSLEAFAFAAMSEVSRLHGLLAQQGDGAQVSREKYDQQVARAERWKTKQREALARAERWKARAGGR